MITLLHVAALWMMMHQHAGVKFGPSPLVCQWQGCPIDPSGTSLPNTFQLKSPPEHVIEIKTKTVCQTSPKWLGGDTVCVKSGDKEIWFDGAFWGVLKGD